MKSFSNFVQLLSLLLLCGISALAQTTAAPDAKQFTKDGLSLNYPAGWSFNDASNSDAQDLTFGRADSDAQVKVFVFRPLITTPEKLAEAKRILVDKYVAATTKSFADMGAKPESAPAETEIGALKAEGVKIRATLDGEPGAAEIYWGVVGKRMVVLTFFGPDKALKKALPAWDTVRSSLQIEEPKPQPQPSPKPKSE
ncbi:MAG: hypothetical protein ACR2HX_12850 [Pyrinomonadaceae bacterium]